MDFILSKFYHKNNNLPKKLFLPGQCASGLATLDYTVIYKNLANG